VVVAAAGGHAHTVRVIRTREVVSTAEYPNFRDAGRTVDASILRILGHLVRRYGESWVSEAGLRRMICEDTGRLPGLDTVRRALGRLEEQGVLEQRHLLAGGILPDGSVCTHGTRLIGLPQCRRARRGLVARSRRETEIRRVQRRKLVALERARAEAFRPAPLADTATRARALEDKRSADLARLAELEAVWDEEDQKKKPPG